MSRVRDEIDQLTRRLTTPAEPAADRPSVLVLLMGHLPVRAGLWRLPAARKLLPDARNIVVAREHDDELCIECIGDVGTRLMVDQDTILDELPSDAVLVLVPSSGAGPETIAELSADRVALVSGCDQAALVGAYRLLKSLAIPMGVKIDLLIAGSGLEQASETVARLGDAALRHLGRQITFAGAIPKIEADTGLSGSCSVDCPAGGVLEIARRARRRSGEAAGSKPSQPVPLQRAMSAGSSEEFIGHGTLHQPEILPGSTEQAVPAGVDTNQCSRLSPSPPRATVPEWNPKVNDVPLPAGVEAVSCDAIGMNRPESTGSMAGTTLLSAHLAGLDPLDIRCPGHESVELAIDEGGGLHLVVAPSQAIRVPAVIGWIEAHRSLLQQALPNTRLNADADPIVHVLGEDVDTLCSLRQSPWRPHLLVKVDPGGPSGWASVCLSRD